MRASFSMPRIVVVFWLFGLFFLVCPEKTLAEASDRGSVAYTRPPARTSSDGTSAILPRRRTVPLYGGSYTVKECWDPYRMRAVTCSELEYLERNRIKENRNKNSDCWDFSRELPPHCRDIMLK